VRRYRFALRPGWLVLHVISVALVIAMIVLGRWQLSVSESKHFSLQNFGYAVQWWLFSGFVLFFWFRLMRDAARRGGVLALPPPEPEAASSEPVAYRRYVMPTTPVRSSDPVHSAYNDYLAALAEKDAEDAS
jgi:DNA-binding transcriptional regulator of glucitol operon